MAVNLNAQGKYAQAQPLYEKALEIRRRLLTDDHPDTAVSYNNVAVNLNAQGKYAQAQPLYEKALEIRRRLLTDDHPDTAISYNNLAANLNAQGKYAQAQPLYEKALEIRRRLLTDDHPDTAHSYNNLAANLDARGSTPRPSRCYEKALEIRRRLLTDDHPDTADSYNNLAANLDAQGKYAQAQPLFEKALEIRRRLLTDDHPDTALATTTWRATSTRQGKYAQAQPLYEKALEIRRRLLTDDHPDTAVSYNNLASNLDAQGKYAQAQPLYEKALEIHRRLLTDDHPFTATGYNNLAFNLNAQGKYLEARDQWLRAVKSLDKARLRVAFTGLERAGAEKRHRAPPWPPCWPGSVSRPRRGNRSRKTWAAACSTSWPPARTERLSPAERARLRELTAELERLDKLVETTPKDLDQAERAKRFEDLKHQRELASIALGEFQTKLVQDYKALAGEVARLNEIQAALPADAALVAWVDIQPVGYRTRPTPTASTGAWSSAPGAFRPGSRSRGPVRTGCGPKTTPSSRTESGRSCGDRPGAGSADLRPLVERLRTQRLEPLAKALGASADGLPPARRLIVLPSPGHGGHPGRGAARLRRHSDGELCTIGHGVQIPARAAPAGSPCRFARSGRPGLRASRRVERAQAAARSRPAGQHGDTGLQRRDTRPETGRCLAGLQRNRSEQEGRPQGRGRGRQADRRRRLERRPVVTARSGTRQARRVIDPRPAPVAIAANRAIDKVLVAARGAARTSPPCRARATRSRCWPSCSNPTIGRPGSCSVPTRVSPSWTAWPPRASWGNSPSSTWRPTA